MPKQCDRLSEEREDFIMTGNRRKKGVVPSQGVEVTLLYSFHPFSMGIQLCWLTAECSLLLLDHRMTAKDTATEAILAVGPTNIPRVAKNLVSINLMVSIGIPFKFVVSFHSFHVTFTSQPLPARRCPRWGKSSEKPLIR